MKIEVRLIEKGRMEIVRLNGEQLHALLDLANYGQDGHRNQPTPFKRAWCARALQAYTALWGAFERIKASL